MDDATDAGLLRVGEVASAAGLTVRALHHYEEIGLVAPTTRTASGHRLYGATEIARLYRVLRLRDLGMPLGTIGRLVDDEPEGLGSALREHLAGLDAEIARLAVLRTALVNATVAVEHDTGSADRWMEVLAAMEGANSMIRQRISILVYRDLARAYDHLVDVFGMTPGELERTPDGEVVHAEVYGGDGVIWLHRESEEYGLASPATVGRATATMAILVDDVDEHYAGVRDRGGEIVYPPVDQPYGYREYSARDAEGMLWSFMKPLADPS